MTKAELMADFDAYLREIGGLPTKAEPELELA